jgi:F-box and WD-40 domain protein 7
MIKHLSAFNCPVLSMDRDVHFLYTTTYDSHESAIHVWEKGSGECVRSLEGQKKVLRLCVDERYIYCTSIYHFTVYEKESLSVIYEAQFGKDISSDLGRPVNDTAFIYFPIRNGQLVVVDKADFSKVKILHKHQGSIWGIAVDDAHLYTGSVDKSILVWEKGSFEVALLLMGHKGNVQRVCVNDRYLLSASADCSVVLWDKKSGEILYRIPKAHARAINGLAFGKQTFWTSSQAQGTGRLWELETGRLLKEMQMRVSESGGLLMDGDRVYIALKQPPCIQVFPSREIFEV